MMDKPKLTNEQQAVALNAIRRLEELDGVMSDLQACGEDCQLRKREASTLRENLQQLLNRFGA